MHVAGDGSAPFEDEVERLLPLCADLDVANGGQRVIGMDDLEGVLSRRQASESEVARHGSHADFIGSFGGRDRQLAPRLGERHDDGPVDRPPLFIDDRAGNGRALRQGEMNSLFGHVIGVDRLATNGQKTFSGRFDGINPGAGHDFGELPEGMKILSHRSLG